MAEKKKKSKGKRGRKRKTYSAEEPVRSDTDFSFRLRHVRVEKMLGKYEGAAKLVNKKLLLDCKAVEALKGDSNWLEKIIPYLGKMPDAWVAKYMGAFHSVIKRLRIGNKIPVYDKDEMLEEAMLQLEKETGLSEEFKDEKMEEIAPQFGIVFPQSAQSAQSADAV